MLKFQKNQLYQRVVAGYLWIILDLLDKLILGGNHIITAVPGIIVGIAILYLPEKNLKVLERL